MKITFATISICMDYENAFSTLSKYTYIYFPSPPNSNCDGIYTNTALTVYTMSEKIDDNKTCNPVMQCR